MSRTGLTRLEMAPALGRGASVKVGDTVVVPGGEEGGCGTSQPAAGNGDVSRFHRIVFEPLVEENGVVEHQIASDRDDGEGVDGGEHAEPQPGDDNLAADHFLGAFNFSQDANSEKDPSDAIVASQGEDHPVSSLAPDVLIAVQKVA